MRTLTAGWDAWWAAYQECYARLPEPAPEVRCPNCGAGDLGLVFRGLLDVRTGYAHFWCGTCLTGVYLCRCPVPDGVPMESLHTPVEGRTTPIPDYCLVWPPPPAKG